MYFFFFTVAFRTLSKIYYAKIGNGFWPETNFAKNLHYWYFRGSEYASGSKYASGF